MSAEVTTVRVTTGDVTSLSVSTAEATSLSVDGTETTTLSISNADTTAISVVNSESTLLTAAAATINVPVTQNLSDLVPLELANTGSVGTSILAARADHIHPSTGMFINGGNF